VIAVTFNARTLVLIAAITLLASAALARPQSSTRSKSRQAPPKSRPLSKAQSAQNNAEFERVVKLGDEARVARRFAEALDLYAKALQMRPTWAEGWWNAGAILYEGDRYEEARDAFRNLVSLDPNRGPAWAMLGLCEYQTKDYERAVVSMQRGRSLGLLGNRELESVVRYHTALLYIRFEQFEIAYDILNEFLLVGNDGPKIIEAFGLTMLRMPFLPNEIPPDRREQILLAGRAGFSMAARRLDEARSAFDQLLARYPDAPNIHYAFGVFLLNQDADAAIKEFRRELEISPSHQPAMVQMAFEYLKRDEYETALPLAEKAAQLAPKMFPARNVLGRVLLELGQIDRAIKELEEGARLAPTSPEMHFALARAYTRAGRKQDAAREREAFKRLQEQYDARRNAARPGNETDNNQPKAKP
jgi:tetratricopeptide (TPR) repeat protein